MTSGFNIKLKKNHKKAQNSPKKSTRNSRMDNAGRKVTLDTEQRCRMAKKSQLKKKAFFKKALSSKIYNSPFQKG